MTREMIGEDPTFLAALDVALRVADSMASVLVCGETGTGKELLARAVHESSGRADRPFVAVNCAAIPDSLLESELFGHEKGAFTGADRRRAGRFERASGGTLFLDEIGDMSASCQAKILRALEGGGIERVGGSEPVPVDVRIITATHRDLREDIAEGTFREDLYYRLATVVVELPPLRERQSDILALFGHYLLHYAGEYGVEGTGRTSAGECHGGCDDCWLSPEACRRIREHTWPGNIRELRNAAERAVLIAREEKILPEHLQADLANGDGSGAAGGEGRPLTLSQMERRQISHVLKMTGGHKGEAADLLGIHRNTLRSKMQEYGLT